MKRIKDIGVRLVLPHISKASNTQPADNGSME